MSLAFSVLEYLHTRHAYVYIVNDIQIVENVSDAFLFFVKNMIIVV